MKQWIVLGVMGCWLLGCSGGDEEGLSCGAGTVESGGQCVPAGEVEAGVEGSAGVGGGGGSAGASGASTPAPCEQSGHCPTTPMVKITEWPDGIDGEPFEIDAYTVRWAEYEVFLQDAADGFVPPQTDELCSWNTDYGMDVDCQFDEATHKPYCEPRQECAVLCADWCDAAQFCAWAGKRLCRSDTDLLPDNPVTEAHLEWPLVCTGGKDPYGMMDLGYEAGECTWDAPCEDYPGVFNMAGGRPEYVDFWVKDEESGEIKYGVAGGGPSYIAPDCETGWAPIQPVNLREFRCCR